MVCVLLTACKEQTIWVYYDETNCFDKWGNVEVSIKEKKKNIKKYLASKNIIVLKLEITNEGILETCTGCSCTTGNRINCKIYESDLQKAINENFYLSKTE